VNQTSRSKSTAGLVGHAYRFDLGVGKSNCSDITEHPSEGDAYCPGKKEDSVWREMWPNTG
jgi:hypothetical protein